MKTNLRIKAAPVFTHEGARAHRIDAERQLRRTVMSCLLFEDTFYESGISVAQRIRDLVAQVEPATAAAIAVEARSAMKLRHAPLLIVREMARLPAHKALVAATLPRVVQRADELAEFLAIYWQDGAAQPLSAQVKKGLAAAFGNFNEYAFAKYDRDTAVKLRDVLFLCHAKPADAGDRRTRKERKADFTAGKVVPLRPREALYYRVAQRELATADTWEAAHSKLGVATAELSEGARVEAKREEWVRLLTERKLGALALLRNLRNMQEAGVDKTLVRAALEAMSGDRVLPFRFIAAGRAVPMWEDIIEPAMLRNIATLAKIDGPTAVLVDHSASMGNKVSEKSEMTRFDAAAAIAMLVRELCDDVRVFSFASMCREVPPRRGFALRDELARVVKPESTRLGAAVRTIYREFPACRRLIVVTDEQSSDTPPAPQGRGYVINVAPYRNGIGYGEWLHIDGWSEAVLDYIRQYEAAEP